MRDPLRLIAVLAIASVIGIRVHYWIAGDRQRSGIGFEIGTSSISGRVVDDVTGAPLARVPVAASSTSSVGRAVTDADGRFEIKKLAAGIFTVEAEQKGYLRATLGEVAPGIGRRVVVLGDADTQDGAVISLWRSASLTGRVLDANGTPVPGCAVQAVDPVPDFTPANFSRVHYRRTSWGRPPGGATNGEGRFAFPDVVPGRYVMSSGCDPNPMLRAFHPRATSLGGAALLTLASGDAREGVDVRAPAGVEPTSIVNGTIIGSDGAPRVAQVTLTSKHPSSLRRPQTVASAADGRFTFAGVPADEYLVSSHSASADDYFWAQAAVTTDGRTPRSVVLSLAPGRTLTVGVSFVETGNGRDKASERVREPQFSLARADAATGVWFSFVSQLHQMKDRFPNAAFEGAESFDIKGVPPGRYYFTAANASWIVNAASLDGRDWLDRPLDISGTQDHTAIVSFADAGAILAGRLEGPPTGENAARVVALFPADASLTMPGSRIQIARAAPDGRFAFAELPAGAYLLAAVPGSVKHGWLTPDFFAGLKSTALSVSLVAGERKTQNLVVR